MKLFKKENSKVRSLSSDEVKTIVGGAKENFDYAKPHGND